MAQSTLNPGDIAIVQYNADNQDQFSFVCLRNIDSGTIIHFTDNGWLSSGSFRATEGTITWEADTIYSCGDIVSLDSIAPIALSSSGDQLFAYQGSSTSPSFVTAFNNEGAAVWQANATNANNSALPSTLTNGVNAIALTEIDNAVYTDSTNLSLANLKNKVFADSSYSGSNTVNQSLNSTFNISGGCVLPVSWLSFKVEHHGDHAQLIWETAQEKNSDRFEIQHSPTAKNFKTLSTLAASGNSNSIKRYQYLDYQYSSGYYRIKQVDFNGDIDYSQTVYLQANAQEINVYMRLGQLHITAENQLNVEIYNSQFQLVTTLSAIDQLRYDCASLAKGIYFIRIENRGRFLTEKISVLK